MSLNVIDIRVATDYTAFTNTLEFTLAVPVSADDAKTVYGDLSAGDWAKIQSDITAAVNKGAPKPIQDVVTALLQAYSGASASSGGAAAPKDDAKPDETPPSG